MAQGGTLTGIFVGAVGTILGGVALYLILPAQSPTAPATGNIKQPSRPAARPTKLPSQVRLNSLPAADFMAGPFRINKHMSMQGDLVTSSGAESMEACRRECEAIEVCVAFEYARWTPGWSIIRLECKLYSAVRAFQIRHPPADAQQPNERLSGIRLVS